MSDYTSPRKTMSGCFDLPTHTLLSIQENYPQFFKRLVEPYKNVNRTLHAIMGLTGFVPNLPSARIGEDHNKLRMRACNMPSETVLNDLLVYMVTWMPLEDTPDAGPASTPAWYVDLAPKSTPIWDRESKRTWEGEWSTMAANLKRDDKEMKSSVEKMLEGTVDLARDEFGLKPGFSDPMSGLKHTFVPATSSDDVRTESWTVSDGVVTAVTELPPMLIDTMIASVAPPKRKKKEPPAAVHEEWGSW